MHFFALNSAPFLSSYFDTHTNMMTQIREHPSVSFLYERFTLLSFALRQPLYMEDAGCLDWFIDPHLKNEAPTVLTPNICLRSGSRKRKGMFETWRRLGVPLASVESPAEPPAPVPPAPHCTPASPWDVSSVFTCLWEEEESETDGVKL